jgi:hypothetical protein
MDTNWDEISSLKKTIRENMQWKETEELIDIWLEQNTDEWTPEALQVVGEILQERGVDLHSIADQTEESSTSLTKKDTVPLPSWVNHAVSSDEEAANRKFTEKLNLTAYAEQCYSELDEKGPNELMRLYRKQSVYLQVIQQVLAERGIDAEEVSTNLELPTETMKCTECNSDLPIDARYCPQCGMEMFPEENDND